MMGMMMGMMGMTLSRSVDIHECATYAIGAVEVKTGAILHEQGIQYENKLRSVNFGLKF